MNNHIEQQHSIECQYCLEETGTSEIYRTLNEYGDHLDSAHVFLCIHCGEILHSQPELDEHIEDVHNCPYCDEVFLTQEERDAHISSNHACPACSEIFYSYSDREIHIETNHDRFIETDGLITDYQADLQWCVGPDSDTDWNAANNWVSSLGDGWRVPTIDELSALYGAGIQFGEWGLFQNSGVWIWFSQPEISASGQVFSFGGLDYIGGRSGDGNGRAFAVRSR